MAKNKKHKQDKFYTKRDLVTKLLSKINILEFDLIIEPSAGDGSFYNQICSINKIGLDIEPECDNITKMDWFNYKIDGDYDKILVIGNPPFGNQGSLAMKFIKKCDEIKASKIAFILPKSFKKESTKRKIPTNYFLIEEIDLDDNSFTLLNKDYPVPCVFQIWERRDERRFIEDKKTNTNLFSFVKKSDNPDYAFRRVGFYAGKVYTEYNDKSEQSHYFIKSDKKIKEILESISWDHNNTAGPRSIGKSELIKKVEEIISST